ncbi:unnamed protein product [Diabrotica balteata]|uniref:Ricin B lectin domain-containing protein n=1 Tax=Diabrotica balteata TaxID=107213 RepID=A0A9N9SVA4_DIABA|nr:unnamed protein product [Diabrotica balteata]
MSRLPINVFILGLTITTFSRLVTCEAENGVAIKNKYTSLVLSSQNDEVTTTFFDDEDGTMVWNITPAKNDSDIYFIVNEGNGKVLEARTPTLPVMANKSNNDHQKWKLDNKGKITSVAYPDRFLTYDENLNAVLNNTLDTLEADQWLFQKPQEDPLGRHLW